MRYETFNLFARNALYGASESRYCTCSVGTYCRWAWSSKTSSHSRPTQSGPTPGIARAMTWTVPAAARTPPPASVPPGSR